MPGIALVLLQLSAMSAAGEKKAQICWTLDVYGRTVYFSEVEGRRDRGADFIAHLDHSGVGHLPVSCVVQHSSQ
ncbi:MAG TPA: hypothetical protein VK602_18760, partial [Phyllobacterium sp.]|nr:hypothetical protein [Phyllobacterium sp.]